MDGRTGLFSAPFFRQRLCHAETKRERKKEREGETIEILGQRSSSPHGRLRKERRKIEGEKGRVKDRERKVAKMSSQGK
jgi:hypothetical protein